MDYVLYDSLIIVYRGTDSDGAEDQTLLAVREPTKALE